VERADIVIEASRPRALAGFGLNAEAAAASGTTWISITAAGRNSDRIGFGDDIAASSGLVAHNNSGEPVFVGDAIADPLSGLMAAALAMSETPTAGHLWDLSMADLVASTLTHGTDAPLPRSCASAVSVPERRKYVGTAPASGSDTHAVLRSLGIVAP
jgi:crotonobetainyl-CoA:carnitine CoA-transferase CaiB-like acyl-CoA transferase